MIIALTHKQAETVAQESPYFLRLLIEKAAEAETFSYKKIVNEVLDFLDRTQKIGAIKHVRETYTVAELKKAFEGIYEFSSLGNRADIKETKELVEWIAASFSGPLA